MDPIADRDDTWLDTGHPEMRLHEHDEYRALLDLTSKLSESARGESFLGDLDLSGRHQTRLDELMPLWSAYFRDFCALKQAATVSIQEETYQWDPRHAYKRTVYTVDEKVWVEFRLKWKIPRFYDLTELVNKAGKMVLDNATTGYIPELQLQIRLQKPFLKSPCGPKIQQKCLLDLPAEILDYIMSFASLDRLRLLSATCKRTPPDWLSLYFRELEAKSRQEAILKVRQQFLEDIDFIHSRPDILQQTRTVSFINEIRGRDDYDEGENVPLFYDLVDEAILRTLRTLGASNNLQDLAISSHNVGPEFFHVISQFTHLHKLNLISCRFDDTLTPTFYSTASKIDSIRILQFAHHTTNEDQEVIGWYLLFLFPNLRLFNIFTPSGTSLVLSPPPVEIHHCGIFHKLRYLSLSEFYHLPSLATWIHASRSRGPISLTHLKIECKWGLPDAEVITLLESLRTAPLQALSLEGLQNGNLILFESIADCLPDLLGLTLIRRENYRQSTSKHCPWPYASWEYAPIFARFTRLEYFCWNYRLLGDYLASPVALLVFEKQADHENRRLKTPIEGGEEHEKDEEIDWELWKHVHSSADEYGYDHAGRLFSAYCPTLKTIADFRGVHCAITRDEGGHIKYSSSDELPRARLDWDTLRGWGQLGYSIEDEIVAETDLEGGHVIAAVL
ncbi:hypothetical protein D9757_014909 [Collybiopsis confluens]|uniref:F-box domain-containing protein n=1 Tax=Collybiopsis confluens TaxID=2823264 RepID=A0A8H5CAK3_9AGAR|nr:hypothetical protein D9757_014909 [Collybiopsis confluens]